MEVGISQLRYHLEFMDDADFSENSPFHDAVNALLKPKDCPYDRHQNRPACERCERQTTCSFSRIVNPFTPSTHSGTPESIPKPYVMNLASPKEPISAGDRVYLYLHLFGIDSDKNATALFEALRVLGRRGVKTTQRKTSALARFTVIDVSQKQADSHEYWNSIYDQLCRSRPISPTIEHLPSLPQVIRISLQTPFVKPKNSNKHTISAQRIIKTVVNRFNAIAKAYAWPVKPIEVTEQEISWYILDNDIRPTNSTVVANKKYAEKTNGRRYEGSIDFVISGAPHLWTAIYYCQWLNIGDFANVGFGNYLLESLDEFLVDDLDS